ncbi:MAG: hypothetical protein ABIG11_10530 [bacterium]
MSPELKEQITLELGQLRRHLDFFAELRAKVKATDPDVPETAAILQRHMEFRHLFRHSYSFDLRWNKMKTLVLESGNTFRRFEKEVETFLSLLKD